MEAKLYSGNIRPSAHALNVSNRDMIYYISDQVEEQFLGLARERQVVAAISAASAIAAAWLGQPLFATAFVVAAAGVGVRSDRTAKNFAGALQSGVLNDRTLAHRVGKRFGLH